MMNLFLFHDFEWNIFYFAVAADSRQAFLGPAFVFSSETIYFVSFAKADA